MQQQFAPQHRLNTYIPTYVPHSDFIPTNQVIDSRQTEAQQVVFLVWFSWFNMSSRNKKVEFLQPNLQISTLEGTFQSELTKMSILVSPYPKQPSLKSSKNEWLDQ